MVEGAKTTTSNPESVEYLGLPYPTRPAGVHPALVALSRDPAAGAVLPIPLPVSWKHSRALYDQTRHGRPIVGGYVSHTAPEALRSIEAVEEALFSPRVIEVLRPEALSVPGVVWGRLDAAMGRAAAVCLAEAFRLGAQRTVHGVVSAPLNKEAFHVAGYDYQDEMAYVADVTCSPEPIIMGVMGSIWTIAVA